MIDQTTFTNMLRSLFNIDFNQLPELTGRNQHDFFRDPVRYFIGTDETQKGAIFREVMKRQREIAINEEIDGMKAWNQQEFGL